MKRGPIGAKPETDKKKSPWLWVILIILLLAGGGYWYTQSQSSGGEDEPQAEVVIEAGEFQAVFLDNGQVYFGKLERSRSDFYTLTDVYYLQSGAVGLDQTSNLSLTKLGNEAHGPEDKMDINVSHILFIEDMKENSKVVNAIRDYKRKQ